FIPALLKPAPGALIGQLWGLKKGDAEIPGLAELPAMLAAGRTSFPAEPGIDREVYRLCGFRLLGPKAVRIDILERLADLIRPALSWRPGSQTPPPDGAVDGRCFVATPGMLSILGATHEDMELILKGLGYRGETKPEADVMAMLPKAAPAEASGVSEPSTASSTEETEQAAAETQPTEANIEPAASAEPAPTVEPVAEASNEEEGAQNVAAPADQTATQEAQADAPESAPSEEAPKTVTLWRPGRQGRREDSRREGRPDRDAAPGNRSDRQRNDGGRPGNKKGRQGHGQGHGQGQGRGQGQGKGAGKRHGKPYDNRVEAGGKSGKRHERPNRPMDPDSPFAKLAQLKADLEKRDG
ncbi:MAG: helicase, partial [Nitratireductor sp.]|nr:helicase [Nitratireductor sp.]